ALQVACDVQHQGLDATLPGNLTTSDSGFILGCESSWILKGGDEMATLVRWQPWTELAGLQTEMSRLMNGLFEGNGRATQAWVPALDTWETEDEFVFAFDLPGIPEDKISVELEDGALTVTGEREQKQEHSDDRFYRFER